jgi:hypothetical protein
MPRHVFTKQERLRGAKAGGRVMATRPAPSNCHHCHCMGYTTWMQHLGHLGFAAVMLNNPSALHTLRQKIHKSSRLKPNMGNSTTKEPQ